MKMVMRIKIMDKKPISLIIFNKKLWLKKNDKIMLKPINKKVDKIITRGTVKKKQGVIKTLL